MNQPLPVLTERTAAVAWARAWNTCDISGLAPLLADDLHIVDQTRWTPVVGARYFVGLASNYFECVRNVADRATMELATAPGDRRWDLPPRPCVVEYRKGRPVLTVLFEVHRGRIRRIEKRLLPPPTDCTLSGIFPGLDDVLLGEVN